MNIFLQLLVKRKLFKIHRNAWKKNKKNDKISKNTYFKIYFVSIIDINIIKKKNIDKQRDISIHSILGFYE